MAWTSPMTATDNATWTSAQWNTYVRDNMNETMPGKAATAGNWFVATGTNAIAERTISEAVVSTTQTTTSTSYADLATVGPAVTATTGTKALVFFGAGMWNSSANTPSCVSVAVSGATTIAASDTWRCMINGLSAGSPHRATSFYMFTTLTAGSNTFTCKYRTTAGTSSFANRSILVMAL